MGLYWDALDHYLRWGVAGGTAGAVVAVVLGTVFRGGASCCCHALLGVLLGAVLGKILCKISRTLKVDTADRAVLITGCDSGFGFALAQHLEKKGLTVFAGCLDVAGSGATTLTKQRSPRLHVLPMDVTNDAQVAQAEQFVRKKLPKNGLWGIVNNAGCATFGEVEWVPISTYKKVVDVNVLGMVRVCKAFLPLLRKSQGRVVNMASGLCRMTVPMRSAYVLSKYAVAGFTECLRMEMKSWGVHVAVIEPGNYIAGTGIFTASGIKREADAMWGGMTDTVKKEYGRKHFDQRVGQMLGYSSGGMADITPVLDAFTGGLLDRFPLVRYQPMELHFKLRCIVATHLPYWVYDALYITDLKR